MALDMNPVCHAVQPPVAQPVQPLHRKYPMITKQRFSVLLLAAAAFTTMVGCAATGKQESTGQYVDDTVITTRVKAEILKDASLKSAEINVETFKGAVQLSGFVNSEADINRAVLVTQGVPGVKSIKNDMRMKK